jgi:hypothetical protein
MIELDADSDHGQNEAGPTSSLREHEGPDEEYLQRPTNDVTDLFVH